MPIEMKRPLPFNPNCRYCKARLIKRNHPPYTALEDAKHLFDYYQCPKCHANFAKEKEQSNDK